MTARASRSLTDPKAPNDPSVEAAFLAAPDTEIAEILDGQLHTMPRPAPRWVLLDTFEGADVVRAEPFDAVAIPLAVLWAR